MNIKLKRVFTAAAAACLLLCSACGGSSAVPTEAPGSPADFSIEIKLGGETYTVGEDGVTLFEYSYLTPGITMDGRELAAEKINAELSSRFGFKQETCDEYVGIAKELLAYGGAESLLPLYVVCEAEAPRADERVLSVSGTVSDYTGGVHGNYFRVDLSFDTSTGELLTPELISDSPKELKSAVGSYILENCSDKESEYGTFWGFEDFAASCMDTGKWRLDADGIRVHADPYEITSYAAGIVDFDVPYSALGGLVRAEFIQP